MSKGSVLVTGGAGYIGSHCCKALHQAGYSPVVIDNLVYGHEEFVKWGPLEQGDIADRAFVDSVLERHRPVAAIHFAAFAYVGESVGDPAKYYANNTCGALGLLTALRDDGVNCVVFSSTCATYGVPETVPIREETPQRPINPYGWSKLMVEHILADFDHAYGMRSVALRYFNAAGADADGEIGERHDPETHLIPLAIAAAAGDGPPLMVNGNDYSTPDGTCVRDYIHVADLADAHVCALDYLLGGGSSQRLNLGTGSGASIRDVLAMIARITGHEVPHSFGPRRPGDPPILVADAGKARSILGWKPSHSDLASIIESAWQWYGRDNNV